MSFNGAGGSEGGVARFFMGLAMMVGGGYLFFDAIRVTNNFGMGRHFISYGNMNMTPGMTLIPLVFGIGIIFYNSKNYLGWGLFCASLIMLGFGVISSIKFRLRPMSAFELISMITLMIGGVGLFLSSLRDQAGKGDTKTAEDSET
jgi:hypothetical protein